MKLHTTVTVRSGWDPHEMETYDLGEIPVHQISMHLAKLFDHFNQEVLVVNISLWNKEKIERKNR